MTAPRSPLRVLLDARRKMLTARLRAATPATRAARAALAALIAAGLVGAGLMAAGPLQIAAARAPDPAQIAPAGGPFAELAFWITALLVTALSFRIMETIYRHDDANLLSTLPIPLEARFADRLLAAGFESLLALAAAALFMLPIFARTGDPRALAGLLLCAAGLWVCLTLGFAVQLYAGLTSFAPSGPRSSLDNVGRFDTGGGTAAAFTVSPGIALTATLGLLLWMKMAAVDELFARGASRLFWIGAAAPAVITLVALAKSRAWFIAHYSRLLAKFYEADLVQFDSGYNYHKSVTSGRHGLFERLVPDHLLGHYRKDALQIGRRYPLLRVMALGLWIVVALLASRDAGLLTAAVPLAWIAAMSAPWVRLYGRDLEPGVLDTLPVPATIIERAKLLAATREVLLIALPCAAASLLLSPWPGAPILAASTLLGALALTPLLTALTRRWGATSGWLCGVLMAAAILGAALGLAPAFGQALGPASDPTSGSIRTPSSVLASALACGLTDADHAPPTPSRGA